MFLNGVVRRRIESLLRPWLLNEPDLELQLGFINSRLTAKNLRFDDSALNRLVEESSGFLFKEVKVERVCIRFSNWSVPAFEIELHGVHGVVSLGEVTEEYVSRRAPKLNDTTEEERKKALSRIDSEGSALHDKLKKIMIKNASRSSFTASLLNLVLEHCHLQIFNTNVQVHIPVLTAPLVCLLELKELNAESQYYEHGCLCRGLIGTILRPLRGNSFLVDFRGFGIGYKTKDEMNQVLSFKHLFTCIKLNDLQVTDFSVRVPELNVVLTPLDALLVVSISSKLSSQESVVPVRNGRQLWRLAANKLRHSISSSRLSLHDLVEFVCVWIRYLNAYEQLLWKLGYSSDRLLKECAVKISQDEVFQNSVRHKWELISGFEKNLPAEAIAQARRIARYRATLNIQHREDGHEESSVFSQYKLFGKILTVLLVVFNVICRILRLVVHCFSAVESLFQETDISEHLDTEDCGLQYLLNFGKISVSMCPKNVVQDVMENMKSCIGISYIDMHSFCLSADRLVLVYIDKHFEQTLSVSCGQFEVKPSSVIGATILKSGSEVNAVGGLEEGRVDDLKSVLWFEPVRIPLRAGAAGQDEVACSPLLNQCLAELWLNWKDFCMKLDENEIEFSEKPWLLCEIKNSLTDQSVQIPACGWLNCSLAVGKLNVCLGYSSIISIAILLGQIQQALYWNEDKGRASSLSHLPSNAQDRLEICWEDKYELYFSRVKMSLLSMLPEKALKLGVLITGSHIQISSRELAFDHRSSKAYHTDSRDNFFLEFDIHDIHTIVWPTLDSDVGETGWLGYDHIEPECQSLLEPQIIEIPKPENEKYAAYGKVSHNFLLRLNGLDVYMGDLSEIQHGQTLILKPISIQLSFFRESFRSFSTTVEAFSAAYCGVATGFSILFYVDDLYGFSKMVAGSFSAVSHALVALGLEGYSIHQELMSQNLMFKKHEDGETSTAASSLINMTTILKINGKFNFRPMDIILQNSRIDRKVESSVTGLQEHNFRDSGIWISVDQTSIEISCQEGNLRLLFNLSKFHSLIFSHEDLMSECSDHSETINFLQQLMTECSNHSAGINFLQRSHCLSYELSLSTCTCMLWLCKPRNSLDNSSSNSVSGASTPYIVANAPSASEYEILGSHSDRFDNWISFSLTMGEILVARCAMKSVLLSTHQFSELQLWLSMGGNFQTISGGLKGGLVVLETIALGVLARCFSSYLHSMGNIFSALVSFKVKAEDSERKVLEAQQTAKQLKWELPEAFSIDVSHFTLALSVGDETGIIKELVFEMDLRLKHDLVHRQRKFKFDLVRLSIFSEILKSCERGENQMSHFSSVISTESPSPFISGNPVIEFQHMGTRNTSNQNQIVSHLVAVLSVEGPKNGFPPNDNFWIGDGFISGFDVTCSLSEIQMISSALSCFSTESDEDITKYPEQRQWSGDEETNYSFEDIVPNGAIVSIQDVHQHMYFAVEERENKCNLIGVLHYSLVGERALFRVKHHKQRMWKTSILWFSLMSLHAKNDFGEPLRLSYRPGSGFVDISITKDNGWSLWRTLPCEPESYKGDTDWEPYNNIVKNTFYLVNKKNDCSIAFVDGIPEFVRKPGNPFKFKVFHDLIHREIAISNRHSLETSDSTTDVDQGQTSEQSGSLPSIHIKIDGITMTIVDELPDSKDKFLLLRACFSNISLDVQALARKTRVMGALSALLCYFDGQQNLWRDFINPVEVCIFHRSSFGVQDSEANRHGVPVHLYCRIKTLEISFTELSLDILLFAFGRLNCAGPFSVRSSMILANCCKVENQSGLNLLCCFYNERGVTVARKQSASIFLSHMIAASQPPENVAAVTIQLSDLGSFATSSLHLSHLKTQAFAWRTRIMSLQDSRTYPGPFVVVDVSRKSEEGLSLVVSPLIRVHNETEFPLELRFRRPQQDEDVHASVILKKGDSIDDAVATFDAIGSSGGLKKALMSLSVGNFLFSFRPETKDGLVVSQNSPSVEWSDELKGGKAVRLSGIFDKLGYEVRKALSVESVKYSFSTTSCVLNSGDGSVTKLHFLIQSVGRDLHIRQPDKSSNDYGNKNSEVALLEQKEIFLLPTVRVSNLLYLEIHVLLSETDQSSAVGSDNMGKQGTIQCGSAANFYANPAAIRFTVTLTAFQSSCKPVNSGDLVKRLLKNKKTVPCLDIDLDFGGGKYFASLRLSRGQKGVLEAAIFTPYSLKNNTDFSLYLCAPDQKPLSRDEVGKFGFSVPPELGLFAPPNSMTSCFSKSHKVRLKLLENSSSQVLLDLDALSGLTEISLGMDEGSQPKYVISFGVSVGPSLSSVPVPSQMITIVPRHVVFNESNNIIAVRQCYLEEEISGMIVTERQRATLKLQNRERKRKEFSLFENVIRKHRNEVDSESAQIQFRLANPESDWSGPVCIASLGRFFLKFRKQLNQAQELYNSAAEFASVHVVGEGSSLVAHFHKPPNVNLPYRIENQLDSISLTYYQKDSSEQEVLGSGSSAYYVWDDLTLPHKLVVLINDMHILREINLDKVRAWKPFHKMTQQRGVVSHSLVDKRAKDQKTYFSQLNSMQIVKVGFEVYAEGPTRVLRFCESSHSHKVARSIQSCAKIQLRVSLFAIQLLEYGKQHYNESEESSCTSILVAKLGNINLDSVHTDDQKFNQINIQSLNVDLRWKGAPFAAMLRRDQEVLSDSNTSTLKIVFVLLSTNSRVRNVKYSSVVLQPIDLNLDEETLMRVASFWRTSLNDSSTPSQRYYFDHFEIHPIKIVANFRPGESYSSYNSAQETLRSLLHSIVKVPPIKNMTVELNGVLVTHALITMRELFIKCAQHYSWYALRAIYIAKGSPLLPPAFVSIFDDLASSSLDVFFDPSVGSITLPGLTLGTFKFISKCIDGKGFSGTKRYFGDLGKTFKTVGSNVLFTAMTEISDSVLRGAETSGFDGMVTGFHQGILKLAMEPSVLGTALMGGGPDRKIKLDKSPGVDELYIEGYLQAMLDTMYRQEYLRVRVIDDQVILKNLPPNSALINEIMDRVKGFLVSKALLEGDASSSRSLRHLRAESEWKIGPTVLTLCEHLFVSFAIRMLRKHTSKVLTNINWKTEPEGDDNKAIVPAEPTEQKQKVKFLWKWGFGKFVLSGILAYIDGRLCRYIPNPVARRIVSGYLLSFLDNSDS